MGNEKIRVCTPSLAVLGEKPKDYDKKEIWEMQINWSGDHYPQDRIF